MSISDDVKEQRQEIKSDKMDMSFGEIINMYNAEEIIITPEYQRAFRWDIQKQTDFIESILLGIPFPSIFVVANEDGKWELIDGLQRVSTVLSFFGELKNVPPEKNNLKLDKGGILPQLLDLTISTLPVDLKLSIKRTPCRIEIIQNDSKFKMRYELFKRLNTGGEGLTRQEIRNCVYRGMPNYKQFTDAIEENAKYPNFTQIATITQDKQDKMFYQELCLRFFALRNSISEYRESTIQDFFDEVMRKQCESPDTNIINETFATFRKICDYLSTTEENIFKLARLNFSPSMYDTIMLTLAEIPDFEDRPIDETVLKIKKLMDDAEFRGNAGSASSNLKSIKNKLEVAKRIFIG